MPVRNGSTKAMLVIAGYAFAVLVGMTLGLSTQLGWGLAASSGIVLLLVLVLSRLFRGANENDEPRTWWRMTAHPTASYVLAVWFGVSAVGSVASAMASNEFAGWLAGLVSLVIGALYLNCAIRLTATNRSTRGLRT